MIRTVVERGRDVWLRRQRFRHVGGDGGFEEIEVEVSCASEPERDGVLAQELPLNEFSGAY